MSGEVSLFSQIGAWFDGIVGNTAQALGPTAKVTAAAGRVFVELEMAKRGSIGVKKSGEYALQENYFPMPKQDIGNGSSISRRLSSPTSVSSFTAPSADDDDHRSTIDSPGSQSIGEGETTVEDPARASTDTKVSSIAQQTLGLTGTDAESDHRSRSPPPLTSTALREILMEYLEKGPIYKEAARTIARTKRITLE